MAIRLTPKEIQAVAVWVEEHVRVAHGGEILYADIAIRHVEGRSGIGDRTVVTCEACEKVKVRNENHHDVTDYDAW